MEESAKQEAWTHAESKMNKQTTTTTRTKGSMSIMEEEEVEQEGVLVARQAEMKQLHVAALEEVMSVNSFFTAAVFIGLSFSASQTSLVSKCMAGEDVAKHLVVSEVTAFSCFLFSTLIAQGLKLQITLSSLKFPPPPRLSHHHHAIKTAAPPAPAPARRPRLLRPAAHSHHPYHINPNLLHIGMILSALGSIVGTIFLMLAMFNVIQIRLGLFHCDTSIWTKRAVYPLLTLVSTGVLSFIFPVLYAVITYK